MKKFTLFFSLFLFLCTHGFAGDFDGLGVLGVHDLSSEPIPGLKIGDAHTNYALFDDEGFLTLVGNARAIKCFYVSAEAVRAPGEHPATFVLSGLSGSWEFSDAVVANQESICTQTKIPCDADITVAPVLYIGWYANGVSPGNSKWQLEYLYVGANSDVTAAAQATITVVSIASTTSNGLVIAQFASMEVAEATDAAVLWKVTRLSGDDADTISASIYLKGSFFKYVADAWGEPL